MLAGLTLTHPLTFDLSQCKYTYMGKPTDKLTDTTENHTIASS